MTLTLIINPKANKGRSLEHLSEIKKRLGDLGLTYQIKETTARGHGIELARQAAISGSACVVAVGGDGTCNEVVNGLMLAAEQGHKSKFGILPLGSGNDFAFALGILPNSIEAYHILKAGQTRPLDIGKVTVDGVTRYFDNGVGLGLDGEVALDTEQAGQLQGFFMYLLSVFRVLFKGRWPYKMVIDEGVPKTLESVVLLTVANGVRAGGGFLLTPQAQVDDGLLDVCYAQNLGKLGVLNVLPRTFNGSHISQPSITLKTATHIKVTVEEGVPAHIDGEILCKNGREFSFEVIPAALEVMVGIQAKAEAED